MKFTSIINSILNEDTEDGVKQISIWHGNKDGKAYYHVDDMTMVDDFGFSTEDPLHLGMPWNETTLNQIKDYFIDASLDHINFQDLKVTEEGEGWKMYEADNDVLGMYGETFISFFVVDIGRDVRQCKDEYNNMVGLKDDVNP